MWVRTVQELREKKLKIAPIQTVKYSLKARDTTSLAFFKKGDVKHTKVDGRLCVNFRNAASAYKREKEEKKKEKEVKQMGLHPQRDPVASKAAMKRKREDAAKQALLSHRKAAKRKATERLQALVAKKKKVQN